VSSIDVRSTDCHFELTKLYVILRLRSEYKVLSMLRDHIIYPQFRYKFPTCQFIELNLRYYQRE